MHDPIVRWPYFHFRRGAVVLTGILILAAVLLAAALASSASLIENIYQQMALLNKTTAEYAATACMEHALGALGASASYAGNETLVVGSRMCTVSAVQLSGGVYTLRTQAVVGSQTLTIEVTLSSRAPPTITGWREI